MSNTVTPQQKQPKLIVVAAFDRNEDGELIPRSILSSSNPRPGQSALRRDWQQSMLASSLGAARRIRHLVNMGHRPLYL